MWTKSQMPVLLHLSTEETIRIIAPIRLFYIFAQSKFDELRYLGNFIFSAFSPKQILQWKTVRQ